MISVRYVSEADRARSEDVLIANGAENGNITSSEPEKNAATLEKYSAKKTKI